MIKVSTCVRWCEHFPKAFLKRCLSFYPCVQCRIQYQLISNSHDTWTSWRLISLATRLVVQQIVGVFNTSNSALLPLCDFKSIGDRLISFKQCSKSSLSWCRIFIQLAMPLLADGRVCKTHKVIGIPKRYPTLSGHIIAANPQGIIHFKDILTVKQKC